LHGDHPSYRSTSLCQGDICKPKEDQRSPTPAFKAAVALAVHCQQIIGSVHETFADQRGHVLQQLLQLLFLDIKDDNFINPPPARANKRVVLDRCRLLLSIDSRGTIQATNLLAAIADITTLGRIQWTATVRRT
jgi:hypothetical protein